MSERYAPEYLRGISHFNRREYFEAHEVWESLWMQTGGEASDFYKGLIQAAVAIHHFERSNFTGARRLYEGSRRYLSRYAPRYLGLDVEDFLRKMDALFAPLLAAPAGTHLEPEDALVPRITLEDDQGPG